MIRFLTIFHPLKNHFTLFCVCIYYMSILFWQDQYQFCYRASLEYLGSFDHYAN